MRNNCQTVEPVKLGEQDKALKNIWKTTTINKKTKIRIFKSNVLSALLYAEESWKVTKGIRHMLEVFQNKCLRRILYIFWPTKITNTELTRANSYCDGAHLVRSKEKKMEVDWPCQQNATDIYSKSSHALDPRRKQEAGTTKRDVEKVHGERDEGSRVELGPVREAGSGQITMAFRGVGLMCEHARRGLS